MPPPAPVPAQQPGHQVTVDPVDKGKTVSLCLSTGSTEGLREYKATSSKLDCRASDKQMPSSYHSALPDHVQASENFPSAQDPG